MGKPLEKNTILQSRAGRVKIDSYLTQGGQGEVYSVELNGRKYAFKYYHKNLSTKSLKSNIEWLIANPIKSKSFAWPKYLVENGDRFGYIMELIPEGYHNVSEWIGGKVDTTIDVLIRACIGIADGFQLLHQEQLSYKDISPSNVYFNVKTGDILIIDNDNITKNLGSIGMKGTPSYMAPELVLAKRRDPTRITDLHSIATLFFQMLCVEHPLHGKKEYNISYKESDEQITRELYAPENATFIFKDSSDLDRYIEPSEESHQSAKSLWLMYPAFIRELFERAFVQGITAPYKRPTTSEWRGAFIKLLGSLYQCPSCKMPHFYSHEEFCRKSNGAPLCQRCGKATFFPRIKIGDNIVVIADNTKLFTAYFDEYARDIFNELIVADFKDNRLYLKNCSKVKMEYKGKTIRYGSYAGPISSGDFITVDKKQYFIKGELL